MKALVTGATGFTGGALCRRLTADGWEVVAFVRESSNVEELKAMGVNCVALDIVDPEAVAGSFPDVDVVFHIAAAYRSEHADQQEFWRVNVDATKNLLDSALAKGVTRFVHCSTVGVQGEIEDPPAAEDYRFKPGDHYQESKLEGEKLALTYVERGLEVTVVRPVGIYGPGDTRFLKLFKPVEKGYFVMVGDGQTLYHMTFIDDLVQGFLLAAQSPNAVGEVFTIAGDRYTTQDELVRNVATALGKQLRMIRVPLAPVFWASVVCDKLCRAIGVAPPLYPRRVEFFQLDRAFSTAKARRMLDYSPRVDLAEGLRRTGEWYRENGFL